VSEKGNCQFAVFAKSTFSEFQKGNFRSTKGVSSYKDGFWRVSKGQILGFKTHHKFNKVVPIFQKSIFGFKNGTFQIREAHRNVICGFKMRSVFTKTGFIVFLKGNSSASNALLVLQKRPSLCYKRALFSFKKDAGL
jgi:hypothetical protein